VKEIIIHEATPSQLDWLIESLFPNIGMTATHVHREGFEPNDFPVRKFTTTPSILWPVVDNYVCGPEPDMSAEGVHIGWWCYVPHHGWFRGETGMVAAARGYLRGVTGMDKHLVPEELLQ